MEMISFLSKSITLFLLQNNIIEKEKTSVYEYGLEVMISTVIGFLLIFTAGLLLNELASAMIFYAMFIIVRQYTGGYHADSHLKCKLTMLSSCLLVLITVKYYISMFTFLWHFIFLITYCVIVFLFAPVEHVNASMSDDLKKRNKTISIIIAIILTATNLFGYWHFQKITMVSSITLFIIAILIIITQISRKEKMLYEKNN